MNIAVILTKYMMCPKNTIPSWKSLYLLMGEQAVIKSASHFAGILLMKFSSISRAKSTPKVATAATN